jgi:uncharacterized protein (DUF3084 family)
MSAINIQEYETKLNNYNQQISAKKAEIDNAERELIVSQTQLQNYQQQMQQLENECLALTGKPISELNNIIAGNMKQLEDLIKGLNANNTEQSI